MKNKLDSLFFIRLFVPRTSQISSYPTRETAFAAFSCGSSNVNVLGMEVIMKLKTKVKLIVCVLVLLFAGGYYYMTLPAINIHSSGFWGFVILLCAVAGVFLAISGVRWEKGRDLDWRSLGGWRKLASRIFLGLAAVLVVVFLLGSLLSSPIVNAGKYHDLIDIGDGNFANDIEQISYNEIPLLDKDSAEIIGNRKMGTMVEYVSQFEVASDYTQINYQDKPVRVTPMRYGNWLKWISNMSDGIPAYIKIDMATQNAECVKLKEGMKYTENDHFNRNIHRFLRFRYPTYIFDTLNFEIDEEGNPVYICPVKDYTIGLFGGETIQKVVIVNAVTGEHKLYRVDEVPEWVDRVYSADLLISYYDYYGSLQHGYWNSVLSQKDCLKTTEGYNYIALDNDVWVYTGVTSVGEDQSNVGFVLMNQRTGETKYYQVSGAEEYSAMSSAEGKVQNLGYKATFPLLLNVADTPTYFLCLKDSAGLVKQYAMVNIEKYTIVAIGSSVTECEEDYMAQLKANGVEKEAAPREEKTLSGKIVRMTEAVTDGNSHFYFLLENNDSIFDASVANVLDIVRYREGDIISFTYEENEGSNVVKKIG